MSASFQIASKGPVLILLGRLFVGIFLIFVLDPVCIDDDMRTFSSSWWFNLPSFSPNQFWVPGHFYFYGIFTGLSSDMVIIPRIVTLILHLVCGALVMATPGLKESSRLLAGAVVLFSPLSLVLGTVPLSESLFTAVTVGGIFSLNRWISSKGLIALFAAALLFAFAAMVRYEGWVLLPIYGFFAFFAARKERFVTRICALSAGLLPLAFPAAWMWFWHKNEGNPLGFLKNIETDSFGSGSLLEAFSDPLTWPMAALGVLVALAAGIRLAALLRAGQLMRDGAWVVCTLAMLALVLWSAITSNVPSQYPVRLVFIGTVLGAVPGAKVLFDTPRGKGAEIAAKVVASAMVVSGLAYALSLEPSYHEPSRAVGRYLAELYQGEKLGGNDRIIVEKHLPESYSVVVHSNRFQQVRINNMGSWCPADMLECRRDGVPRWAKNARVAVVWSRRAKEYLKALGWQPAAVEEPWIVYARPSDAAPLGGCPGGGYNKDASGS